MPTSDVVVSEAQQHLHSPALAPGASVRQVQVSPRQLRLVLLFVLLLSTCTAPVTPLPSITPESSPVNSSVQITTATPSPIDSFIGDAVPLTLREQFEGLNVHLDISTSPTQELQTNETQFEWIYALVAPFPTVKDGVTSDELKLTWMEGTA